MDTFADFTLASTSHTFDFLFYETSYLSDNLRMLYLIGILFAKEKETFPTKLNFTYLVFYVADIK
jgi:hypothetical protein